MDSCELPNGGNMAFRPVFSAGASLEISRIKINDAGIDLWLDGVAGTFETHIGIDNGDIPVLRYTT